MGASDFDDSFSDDLDDDELNELDAVLNRPTAVNRQVSETVIRRPLQVQRTLTGEALEGEPVRYEEIQRTVTYRPTHHEIDRRALQTYVYPKNFEVRDYQFDIIAKALYRNLLCAIPTGMGKTFIASTVMLNYYRWFKKGKIIFMAPTRPLVAQQIQACLGVTDIPSSDTAVLLDKSRKNRPEIWNSKRVFFATPQVVENDLKSGTLDPKEVVCVVIDEAHRARKSYAYTNVVKFIERFNTSFRVLALTATPAADIQGVQEVVNNLSLSKIEIRTEESMDIVKYMKKKETTRVNLGTSTEMEEIIELLSTAIDPVLKLANEADIYEVTDPARINAFVVMQKSQALILNPQIPEAVKWRNFFILQCIGHVGQMLRRLKIYGVKSFYGYFVNKRKEFQTKFEMGKSTNNIAKSFFYHHALKQIDDICKPLLEDKSYVSHPKLEYLLTELEMFVETRPHSRVIVFTELRESALEIVQTIDNNLGDKCKSHIFIGQARGKEGFDDTDYKMKHGKKGRGKAARQERIDKEQAILEQKEREKKAAAEKRQASRTSTSEEAQLQGMNQKQQKELIKKFKKGEFQVLVATSIGEEGLDIGEVDLIICYDTTGSPIKNIQRMGRTGRKNDGRIVLLLAANEENKFNQAMEDYANVQKQIVGGALNMHKSDRIIPDNINPKCEKVFIEIPEDNLIIARGEDEDEVIKHATQAMLGKSVGGKRAKKAQTTLGSKRGQKPVTNTTPASTKKRFFMPDDVETGFVTSSKLVRKVGGDESANSKKNVSISLDSDDDLDNDKENSSSQTKTLTSSANRPNTFNTSGILKGLSSINKPQSNISTPSKNSHTLDSESPLAKKPAPKGRSSHAVSFKKLPTPEPEVVMVDDDIEDTDFDDDDEDILRALEKPAAAHQANVQAPDSLQENLEAVSPVRPVSNRDILEDLSFSKAFDDEEEQEEIPDSEMDVPNSDDQDSRVFQDTVEKIRRERGDSMRQDSNVDNHTSLVASLEKPPSLSNKLLTFEAFEDNDEDEDVDMSLKPFKDAAKVMDKQYEEDPSFGDCTLEPSEPMFANTGTKRRSTGDIKSVKIKQQRKEDFLNSTPKMDIANMLKNRPLKSKLGVRKKVDMSKVKESEIIELVESQSTQVRNLSKEKPIAEVYLSQFDRLVPREFDSGEGILTESESTDFYCGYFAESTNVFPDLRRSVRLNVYGSIGHSKNCKRFVTFTNLCGPKGEKRLNKMIEEMKTKSKLPYSEEVNPTDIIVKDDAIEQFGIVDGGDLALSVIDEGGDHLDEFPNTASLLGDDDDDDFNDL